MLTLIALALVGCGSTAKMNRADGYMSKGDYQLAERTYQQVLDKKPEHGQALLGVAEAWIQAGRPQMAISPARKAVEQGVNGADRLLLVALVRSGRGAEALAAAEMVAQEDPSNPAGQALLAEARLASGDERGAWEALGPVVESGKSADVFALAAWLALRNGLTDRAVVLATRASGSNWETEDARVLAEAATVFMYAGEDDLHREAAGLSRATVAEGMDLYERQAAEFDKAGDLEGAIRHLSWSVALDHDDGRKVARLGLLYFAVGDFKAAADHIERGLDLPPYELNTGGGGVRVASAYTLSPEDWKREVANLLDASKLVHDKLGDPAGSANALERKLLADLITPTSMEWYAVAQLWYVAREYERAVNAAKIAAERDPANGAAYWLMAHALADSNQIQPALSYGRRGWSTAPSAAGAIFLGGLYEKRGEREAAGEIYAEAMRRFPDDSRLRTAFKRVQ